MLKDIRTLTHSGELEIYEPKDIAKAPSYAKFFRMSDVINFGRHYAKQKVIMQKQSLENINVQIPHLFSPDADSES